MNIRITQSVHEKTSTQKNLDGRDHVIIMSPCINMEKIDQDNDEKPDTFPKRGDDRGHP